MPNISKSSGGIYQYSLALIKLLTEDRKNRYFLFSELENPEIADITSQSENMTLLSLAQCRDGHINYKFNRLKEIANKFIERTRIRFKFQINFAVNRIIKKYKIDILHCPYDEFPRSLKISGITTIHDMQELHFPSYFTPKERMNRAISKKRIIEDAKCVICSYDHIKEDIEKFFPDFKGSVETILLEMTNLWFTRFDDENIISQRKLGFPNGYILYPAATWEHKNHKLLLQAFVEGKKKEPTLKLICTGEKTDFFFKEIAPMIDSLGLQNDVIFTGVVEDMILYSLYKQSIAVVIPTLYEAGSFPLMESILMGIPVICANVTSLPDTIGSKDFVFNPSDLDEMVKKIIEIYSDEHFRETNIRNSAIQKLKLSETGALDLITNVYRKLNRIDQR